MRWQESGYSSCTPTSGSVKLDAFWVPGSNIPERKEDAKGKSGDVLTGEKAKRQSIGRMSLKALIRRGA